MGPAYYKFGLSLNLCGWTPSYRKSACYVSGFIEIGGFVDGAVWSWREVF